MVNKYLRTIQTSILFLISFAILGQTSSSISNPILEYKNGNLFINYEIDGKSPELYNVWIEVINARGEEIKAKSLSGDFGHNIETGKNKIIIWDIPKDNILLDESISVKVKAELISKQYSKGKLVIQSTIWPGWGQTKLKNGKPYWLIGVAGVACAAGSYWYNQESVKSYNQYIRATADGDKYYDQAMQHDNTAKILGYSAIGIWAANILWVALMPDKASPKISQNVGLSVRPLYAGENISYVSLSLSLNLKP